MIALLQCHAQADKITNVLNENLPFYDQVITQMNGRYTLPHAWLRCQPPPASIFFFFFFFTRAVKRLFSEVLGTLVMLRYTNNFVVILAHRNCRIV